MIHAPEPRLHSFTDVSDDGETGEVIAQKLVDVILDVGPAKVACIVSDHAASMRKAWQLVKVKFPWIHCEGCKAHGLNLGVRDIFENGFFKSFIDRTADIVKFFR